MSGSNQWSRLGQLVNIRQGRGRPTPPAEESFDMASFRIASCMLVIGLGAATAACGSSSDSNNNGGSGGTSASGGAGGSLGGSGGAGTGGSATGGAAGSTGTGGGKCLAGPGYPSSDAPHQVNAVTATILDLNGQPAAQTLAQVCGIDICINGSTNNQGEICQPVSGQPQICGTGIQVNGPEKRPALKYGDGIDYAKFAYLLPTNTSDYTSARR